MVQTSTLDESFVSTLSFGPLEMADAERASELILSIFWRFNAEQYGNDTSRFTDTVTPERLREFIRSDVVVGAKDRKGNLCGVICITRENHLELMYVSEAYQRLGIGSALWTFALELATSDLSVPIEITVNSSDYAIPFYEALGFVRVPFERPTVKRLKFRRTI